MSSPPRRRCAESIQTYKLISLLFPASMFLFFSFILDCYFLTVSVSFDAPGLYIALSVRSHLGTHLKFLLPFLLRVSFFDTLLQLDSYLPRYL